MDLKIECILMGLLAIVCSIIYNNIDSDKQSSKNKKSSKNNQYYFNIIISFIIGFLIHYLYTKNNINEMYCKKVCYGDECFMVCSLKN